MSSTEVIIICLALAVIYTAYNRRNSWSSLPLPPGPKGLPLIGNMYDMPTSSEWEVYHRLSKDQDSDIIHLQVGWTSIIVLDSYKAAVDLLDKRSLIYSGRQEYHAVGLSTSKFSLLTLFNRPRMPMMNELMGWEFNLGNMTYGNRWREHRRLMHSVYNTKAVVQFHPRLLKASRNLLNSILDTPDDIVGNLKHMAGEIVFSTAYGLEVQPKNDPYITGAEKALVALLTAAVPGAFLVDMIPLLKYVPEWMPGADFQKKARKWKKLTRELVEAPFAAANRRVLTPQSDGVSDAPSFVSIILQNSGGHASADASSASENTIENVAGTLYSAGSDTIFSVVVSCVLGLLEKPDVLEKAQAELDSVIKPGHLPDFSDKSSLPYITAIVKETLRWRDVAPTGAPHVVTEDDEYEGYRIPRGSIVMANLWAMLHDENLYPDPFAFNPDRFIENGWIKDSAADPERICWGFGRRICPGQHLAFSAAWIAVASMLTVFDIRKAVDKDGNVTEPSHEYMSTLVRIPKPYACSITPRSKQSEELIRLMAGQSD